MATNLPFCATTSRMRASISSISIRRSIPTPITIYFSRRRTGTRARRRARLLMIPAWNEPAENVGRPGWVEHREARLQLLQLAQDPAPKPRRQGPALKGLARGTIGERA